MRVCKIESAIANVAREKKESQEKISGKIPTKELNEKISRKNSKEEILAADGKIPRRFFRGRMHRPKYESGRGRVIPGERRASGAV